MANTFSNNVYSSNKTLTYLTIGCFFGLIICFVLYFLISLVETVFEFPTVLLDSGENVSLGIAAIGLIGLFEILLRWLTILFFLVWLFKAFKNLPALEVRNLEFSPGWAVGWWFIPFANLVKPYQVVSELWRESNADFDSDTFLSNQIATPSIIGWWWGLFIAGNIVGRISDKLIDVDSPYFAVVLMIACILHGISAYLIIQIISNIRTQQELRFQKLGSIGSTNRFSEPPLPPTFN